MPSSHRAEGVTSLEPRAGTSTKLKSRSALGSDDRHCSACQARKAAESNLVHRMFPLVRTRFATEAARRGTKVDREKSRFSRDDNRTDRNSLMCDQTLPHHAGTLQGAGASSLSRVKQISRPPGSSGIDIVRTVMATILNRERVLLNRSAGSPTIHAARER